MRPIPQIWATLPLKDYADDFGEETLRVWLNPTLDLVTARGAMLRETARLMSPPVSSEDGMAALNERMFDWLASVVEGITADEIRQAHRQSPDFVMWLVSRATRMMDEHGQHKKKA